MGAGVSNPAVEGVRIHRDSRPPKMSLQIKGRTRLDRPSGSDVQKEPTSLILKKIPNDDLFVELRIPLVFGSDDISHGPGRDCGWGCRGRWESRFGRGLDESRDPEDDCAYDEHSGYQPCNSLHVNPSNTFEPI